MLLLLFLSIYPALALGVIGLVLLAFARRYRRIGAFLAGGSLLWIVLVWTFDPSWIGNQAFDRDAWMDARATGKTVIVSERVHMVDSLLVKHPLKGQTRRQVIELIGEPTQTNYFNEWDMVYWLGPERCRRVICFAIDSEWLVIDLDENGRVARHDLVTD